MEEKSKIQLSKEWVMVMLYKSPLTLDELVTNGCRVMVYGWNLPQFKNIIKEMRDSDETVYQNSSSGKLSLTTDGIFYIKKNTLLPLIQISEDPTMLTQFVSAYKERCDTELLDTLTRQPSVTTKENSIKSFARDHYEDIAKILHLLIPFLST